MPPKETESGVTLKRLRPTELYGKDSPVHRTTCRLYSVFQFSSSRELCPILGWDAAFVMQLSWNYFCSCSISPTLLWVTPIKYTRSRSWTLVCRSLPFWGEETFAHISQHSVTKQYNYPLPLYLGDFFYTVYKKNWKFPRLNMPFLIPWKAAAF